MNGFVKKKISSPSTHNKAYLKRHLFAVLGVCFILFFLYQAGAQLVDGISSTKLVKFVSGLFGRDLLVDDNGHTNILLLGVGGVQHEGGTLTDSMMIASINHDANSVAMLSIPRDLYVKSSLGSFRVNQIFEEARARWDDQQGLDFTQTTIQEIFGIPLHYVIKVDFKAVEAVVDSVGGIDIYVQSPINDPLYPKDETFEYETFVLDRGLQHLDGKTALKYVRSRKTSSDFDRSRRQQQVLVALKQKALQKNIFKSASRLKDMYSSLNEHIVTTMSIREMLALAEFAKSWDSKNITSATLNDEPLYTGGFLYTPLRSLYGGAYVLLPAGDNFKAIQEFARLVIYGPPNLKQHPVIILNGTGKNGLAGKTRAILNRFGANIDTVGNARNEQLEKTTWYAIDPNAKKLADSLANVLSGAVSSEIPGEYQSTFQEKPNAIIFEIGNDGLDAIERHDIFRNIVPLTPTAPAASGDAANATSEASGAPPASTETAPPNSAAPKTE